METVSNSKGKKKSNELVANILIQSLIEGKKLLKIAELVKESTAEQIFRSLGEDMAKCYLILVRRKGGSIWNR